MKIGQTNSIIYKLQDKTCSEEEEKKSRWRLINTIEDDIVEKKRVLFDTSITKLKQSLLCEDIATILLFSPFNRPIVELDSKKWAGFPYQNGS